MGAEVSDCKRRLDGEGNEQISKKKTPKRICERRGVSVNEPLEFLRAFLLSGKRSLDQIKVRKVDEVQESESLTK